MKYLMLRTVEQDALIEDLRAMPDFLAARFSRLSTAEAAEPGPAGTFSPVEQCWHLADLESEGFGVRIRRLRSERDPFLPDFDGAAMARERAYRTRSLAAGVEAFRNARMANIALLRSLDLEQWSRAGTQEGVGRVTLCDLPLMMAEHDAAHRREIGEEQAGRS